MRSEEEISQDIVFYEKKAQAREHMAAFAKKKRLVKLITAALAIVLSAICAGFVIRAYDSENIILMIFIVISILIFAVAVYFAAGSLVAGSPKKYLTILSFSGRWKEAEEKMRKLEEKYLDQTVYEDDMVEAEEHLIALADKINEYFK